MTYLSDLHTYLHQSSLLIQAYPTTRITTKYSLPRKTSKTTAKTESTENAQGQAKEKREPSATLTLKTFHPESGICLKYRTDKAQEVGRLMTGLGRLAKGEIIEMPSTTAIAATTTGDKMDVDEVVLAGTGASTEGTKTPIATTTATATTTTTSTSQQGGGGKKKKKGKK